MYIYIYILYTHKFAYLHFHVSEALLHGNSCKISGWKTPQMLDDLCNHHTVLTGQYTVMTYDPRYYMIDITDKQLLVACILGGIFSSVFGDDFIDWGILVSIEYME